MDKLDRALRRRQSPQQQQQQQEGQAAQQPPEVSMADDDRAQQPMPAGPAATTAAGHVSDQQQQQHQQTQSSSEQPLPAPSPAEVLFDVDAAVEAEIKAAREATLHYAVQALTEDQVEQYLSIGTSILQRYQIFDAADGTDLSFVQYVAGVKTLGQVLTATLLKTQSVVVANQRMTAQIAAAQKQHFLQQQANHMQVLGQVHQLNLRQQRLEGMVAQLLQQQQQHTTHIGEGVDLLLLNGTTLQHSMTVMSQQVQHMHKDLAFVSADRVRLASLSQPSATQAAGKMRGPAAKSKHAARASSRAASTGPAAVGGGMAQSCEETENAATEGSACSTAVASRVSTEWPGLITNATGKSVASSVSLI